SPLTEDWAKETSSMISGSIPVRSSTALIAVAASSSTGTARRLPPNVPTGVRTGATIAALRLVVISAPPFSLRPLLRAQPGTGRPDRSAKAERAVGPGLLGHLQVCHSGAGVPGLELTFHQLARLAARQAVDEADDPRRLEGGDLRLHERDDLLLEFGSRDGAGGGLDERGHRLPHLRVGHADDRDVVDGRVQREHVLGFLRVDVDAAGDDRERLAVGEEQEAVLVEVADVAEGGPVGVVPVLGSPGLIRVVVVGERDLFALEVDAAGLA